MGLWQDIRFGVRMLWKRPGFTLVAVFALALGIGANTAIFSVVNTILLRPLPYEDAAQLVALGRLAPGGEAEPDNVSYLDFADLKARSTTFENMALYRFWLFNITGSEQPEAVMGAFVSASLFPTLKAEPIYGRALLPEEDRSGERVAVISYRLWQRRFGANPDAVGKSLWLGDASYTVVGVMGQGFNFPPKMPTTSTLPSREFDVYVPLGLDPSSNLEARGNHNWFAIGRVETGVSLAQARTDLQVVTRRLAAQYPETNEGDNAGVVPLNEIVVGDLRAALWMLLAAVGAVLFIACSNVANLMLARAAGRRKEIVVRAALGAGRWRLARQLLTESVMLALVGGVLGLLLASWGVDVLVALSPNDIPRVKEIDLDLSVLFFTVLVSVLTGVLFGLAPALQASRADLQSTLREGTGRTTGSVGQRRTRGLLVISQLALALMLLVGAGLMIKSFLRLQAVDSGLNPACVLTTWVLLPDTKYPQPEAQARFFDQALQRIATIPGVEYAGAISSLPLTGMDASTSFSIEGRPPAAANQAPETEDRRINADYFRAMGITLIRGREFTRQDDARSPDVVIINETFARLHFAGEDPLSKRLDFEGEGSGIRWRQIVGVVKDVKHFGLEAAAKPEAYIPFAQSPSPFMVVAVRTAADPAGLATAILNQIQAVDKDQPVFNTQTMERVVADSVARRRLNVLLLGIFAALALTLAVIGIYGVMSYLVAQRTHEIGVRIALGARAADVLRLVVKQGMSLALAGVVIGLIGALIVARLMSSLLYGVSAIDPFIFIGVPLLLSGVALIACYIPARRATKVDPLVALRYE